MHGHVSRCVENYCELANVKVESLKKVTTPNLDDHQLQPEDFEDKGKLAMARLQQYEQLGPRPKMQNSQNYFLYTSETLNRA